MSRRALVLPHSRTTSALNCALYAAAADAFTLAVLVIVFTTLTLHISAVLSAGCPLDHWQTYASKIFECGIVVAGRPRWIIVVTLGHDDDHALAGSGEQDAIGIL